MKLAEALQERADLNRKIEELKSRILSSVLVQEGEQPAEDPALLKKQADQCLDRLCDLMAMINLTNSRTVVEGRTLTEWIALKDALTLKLAVYRDVANEASSASYRVRGSEIKLVPVLAAQELRQEIDELAKALRMVENRLQESNWTSDLME